MTSLDEKEARQLDEQLQQLPHYRAETFLQLEARVEEAQVYTLQCLAGTLELNTRLSLGNSRRQLMLMCVWHLLISVVYGILASKFDDSEFIMAVVETRHSRQFSIDGGYNYFACKIVMHNSRVGVVSCVIYACH